MATSRCSHGRLSMARVSLLLAFVLSAWLVQPAQAAPKADCPPANGVSFICGVTNVEDFAPVPNSQWVIGGDLAAAGTPQGYFYLFDTARRTGRAIQPSEIAIKPDKKTYPDCPGPVNMKLFGPHGLDLTRSGGTHPVLYAVKDVSSSTTGFLAGINATF